MEWINYILPVLSGLITAIPLVIQLVKWIQKAIREKNWNNLIQLTMNLMQEAETKFEDGATKKEWVLAMVQASADTINYDVDIETLGQLIDSLCDMSKVVNVATKTPKQIEK